MREAGGCTRALYIIMVGTALSASTTGMQEEHGDRGSRASELIFVLRACKSSRTARPVRSEPLSADAECLRPAAPYPWPARSCTVTACEHLVADCRPQLEGEPVQRAVRCPSDAGSISHVWVHLAPHMTVR